jgi:hypothetical protein
MDCKICLKNNNKLEELYKDTKISVREAAYRLENYAENTLLTRLTYAGNKVYFCNNCKTVFDENLLETKINIV